MRSPAQTENLSKSKMTTTNHTDTFEPSSLTDAEGSNSEMSSINGDESPSHAAAKLEARSRRQIQSREGREVTRYTEMLKHALSKPWSWSCLKLPGLIVPEAFDSLPHRIYRQIASATGISLEIVMKTFDNIFDDPLWRERQRGCSIEDLQAFARQRSIGLKVFHGSRLEVCESAEGHNDRTLVCSYWCGHFYMLRDAARIVQNEKIWEPACRTGAVLVKSLRRPPKDQSFPEEFPWEAAQRDIASIPPGRYWVHSCDGRNTRDEDVGHNMAEALRLFMQSGRYPSISLARYPQRDGRPEDKPLSFTYHKTAYDGEGPKGEIVVRSMAMDAAQTREWASKLDIPYGGQSLGSFSSVVLDILLRRRVRQGPTQAQKAEIVASLL